MLRKATAVQGSGSGWRRRERRDLLGGSGAWYGLDALAAG
jgi:hypothetical protein